MAKPRHLRKHAIKVASAEPDVKYSKCLRKAMYRQVSNICQCCGTPRTQANGLVLTVHHIRPVRAGGMATRENGLVCCKECHLSIHKHVDPLGDVERNFWIDLKDYLFTLPDLTQACKARFSSDKEYIKEAA